MIEMLLAVASDGVTPLEDLPYELLAPGDVPTQEKKGRLDSFPVEQIQYERRQPCPGPVIERQGDHLRLTRASSQAPLEKTEVQKRYADVGEDSEDDGGNQELHGAGSTTKLHASR